MIFNVSARRCVVLLAGALVTCPLMVSEAATPRAWFKADSLGLADAAAVTIWADSSKNGHIAQNGNVAPTYAAAGMNGYPSVRFNGTQTMVFPRPVQDDFTIMVLFKTANGAGGSDNFYAGCGLVSGEQGGVVNDYGMSIRDNGRVLAGTGNPDVTMRSDSGPGNSGYDNDQPHIATFSRTRSSGALELFVNRVSRRTAIGGTQSLSVFSQLCIGAHPGNIGPFLNGDIAEVIVFDGAMALSEVVSNEDALRGKYGLSNGTVPLVPQNSAADGRRITWSEAVGARSYTVYRSGSATGPFTMIAENLVATSFTDTTAAQGQTSFYQIVAVNSVGSSPPSATVEGVTIALPSGGPVVINEIHYNGLNNALHSDFIEIFNYSADPADLSGWRLSGGVDFVFPANTVMAPGDHLVIAQDPAVIQTVWNVAALGPYLKSLSSDGETIRLRNLTNVVVSEVSYKSGFPWPCAANGEGASAELVHPGLDATKGSSWRSSVSPSAQLTGEVATPGSQNLQFNLNPGPNIENVVRSPLNPASGNPITVTADLSDADGIASATLSYQIVAPGTFIPAKLPLPIVDHNIDTSQAHTPNPDFETPANWTNVAMHDDGLNGDLAAADGTFTAIIPGQANRSLVRYRVTAADVPGVVVRAPFDDDMSKNFACFVYNGVPDYQGVPSATLNTLPVYHFLSRKADYDQCVAYNSADQLSGNTPGWTYENWEGAIVFDGVVHDHIRFRLHGGNGRYYFTSKRGFRFFFNKGYEFQNRDNDGELLPTRWRSMTTENCWENRGTLTYSLNEMVNFHLWRKVGIPAPRSNWGHFRTITTAAEQADPWHGDFWGLIMIHEDYNGDFLDSHELQKGNLYKLTRDATDGASQQRYQASDAVSDGSDHANVFYNLDSNKDDAFVNRYVNLSRWSYYHALCQAVRHYDYWPTGDNNGAYYFEPDFTDQTDHLGKLWILPNDVDATWGPTWNEGKDKVWSSIFDSPPNPALYPIYFNAVREVRDLLWQPDQINPLLDQFAAVIAPFIPADSARWKNAPNDAGNYNGIGGAGSVSLANLVADMKNFAWVGGSWPGDSGSITSRAAFLDSLQLGVSNSEGSVMPATPTLTYQGPVGYPTNQLTFAPSAFSDPQGAGDFAFVQWRVAKITDPSAPAYDPLEKFKLEWSAEYDTGELPASNASFTVPGNVCKTGHSYRVRVRHKDLSGRWSHWSAAAQFTAGANTDDLPVVVGELLYKPAIPTQDEIDAGFTDKEMFEYLEIRNVGAETADLAGCTFSSGLTFTFPPGSLLPSGSVTLIVSNADAFNFRYGSGRPVAGVFTGNLGNSGERIRLTTAAGTPLVDFTYDDAAPWPSAADTGGFSLVLIDPTSNPDPALAVSWRASRLPGGVPGGLEDVTYQDWTIAHAVTGGSSGDDDGDGLNNTLEYALNTDPHGFTPNPAGVIQSHEVSGLPGDYLTTTFTMLPEATDILYQVEHSTNLSGWDQSPVLVGEVLNPDGSVTQTWRTAEPVSGKGFLRVNVRPR